MMSNIGKKLRQYREDHNLTQQELALKLRIGTRKIEMYESGEAIPDTQTILRLSTVLDIPASEFIKRNPGIAEVDEEIEDIVKEIGPETAKMLLRTAKDVSASKIMEALKSVYKTPNP